MDTNRLSLTVLASLFAAVGCGGGDGDGDGDPAAEASSQPATAPVPVEQLITATAPGQAGEMPPGIPQGGADCPHPAWVQGRLYPAGSIVTYQANLYIARYQNPGYNPTISTYFWVPYDCVASVPCSFPQWVEGFAYRRGDIANYQARPYVAEHDNPGYNPTVSTYFWDPHACAPTPAPSPAPSPTPAPPPGAQPFSLESQGETRYLVVNWWRGDPAREGDFRQPGICTGPAPEGNCVLGARKTFRPQGFYLQNTMLWLEVPQYVAASNTYDHYPLPIELVRDPNSCRFSVRHIRTHGALEFPLNPPGLEILPHSFTMTQALCDAYNPADATWVRNLNAALDAYLGPDPAPYTPDPYPYNDPRTGRDPSQ